MKHRYLPKCFIGGFLAILMLIPAFVYGAPFSVAFEKGEKPEGAQKITTEGAFSVSSSRTDYDGRLVVYIIEPVSRWDDDQGDPFDYAIIDIPFNDNLFISESETVTFTWDATGTVFDDVTSDNIMVMAGLASNVSHQSFSDPPYGSPFDAYYYDFSASATPGVPGSSTSDEDYTHTVMVEVLSATW
ncbi:MAG TPA: hypothetical protein ENL22_03710 [candidate division Zixibacteria bacterium]|nr:hypothetical protein [candidate division Zixibacteria bacterium]